MSAAQSELELIDSHAHLDTLAESEREASTVEDVLGRARAAGVVQIVAIGQGGGPKPSASGGEDPVLRLARTQPGIFATVGVHPHEVAHVAPDFVANVLAHGGAPEVVAIGEIGLDYHYDHSPRADQQHAFAAQLDVARELGKPVVIHSREADDDTAAILREAGADRFGGVIHCFTAGPGLARAALDMGFDISISGIVTFKNAGALRDIVKWLPLDRLLIETDSPFLAPIPHRGRPNEPAFVRLVAESVANLLGLGLAEIAAATTANARRRFALGPSCLGAARSEQA